MWHSELNDWTKACNIQQINSLFTTPPPIPDQNQEKSPKTNNPPPNPEQKTQANNHQAIQNNMRYENHQPKTQLYNNPFTFKNLSDDDINQFKQNYFLTTFSSGVGILLHFLTFGIFTIFNCGLKHSKLPILQANDFSAGKAIGFLFIPIFNIYWIFIFWRRLAMRINFQFELRNQQKPVSLGLATTVCILTFIPFGGLLNMVILIPILYGQTQSAANKLAHENLQNQVYRR